MRYGIISDVHANLEALRAIKKDMDRFYPQINRIANLGDSVGYGPNPNEVMEELEGFASISVVGNHDEGVAGVREDDYFSQVALSAIEWTRDEISKKNFDRLNDLIKSGKYSIIENGVLFAHSTPHLPENMKYISIANNAHDFFFSRPLFNGLTAFVGHTHIPQVYTTKADNPKLEDIENGRIYFEGLNDDRQVFSYDLSLNKRSLVCVPGAGQPRDSHNMTGYAFYDSESKQLEIIRVPYDYEKTQEKMRTLEFDSRLIDRLAIGR